MDNENVNSKDECPMGEACAVHFRNDEVYLNGQERVGRMINYIGEFCVITGPNMSLAGFLGIGGRYEVVVEWVGTGALADKERLSDEDYQKTILMDEKFSDWERFRDCHYLAVDSVRTGVFTAPQL
jgi:hypothetical protein